VWVSSEIECCLTFGNQLSAVLTASHSDTDLISSHLIPSTPMLRHIRVEVVEEMVLFGPDLLIFSAGFDAHDEDPLADCELLEDDFVWCTQIGTDSTCAVTRMFAFASASVSVSQPVLSPEVFVTAAHTTRSSILKRSRHISLP
jgi:Histone deacetylase domain